MEYELHDPGYKLFSNAPGLVVRGVQRRMTANGEFRTLYLQCVPDAERELKKLKRKANALLKEHNSRKRKRVTHV